jgi:hypothetical protein
MPKEATWKQGERPARDRWITCSNTCMLGAECGRKARRQLHNDVNHPLLADVQSQLAVLVQHQQIPRGCGLTPQCCSGGFPRLPCCCHGCHSGDRGQLERRVHLRNAARGCQQDMTHVTSFVFGRYLILVANGASGAIMGQ